MAQDEDGGREIGLQSTPEMMAGAYANFATVSHSDYEFTITFSRLDHEVEEGPLPGVVVARVALSAKAMRELVEAMADNYSKWSTKQSIKDLPEFRPPDEPPEH
jgi:uncharacterized protein DUF3467